MTCDVTEKEWCAYGIPEAYDDAVRNVGLSKEECEE